MTELEKATAILSAASGADATAVAEQLTSDADPQAVAAALFDVKFKDLRDQGNRAAIQKTRRDVERAFKAAGVETVNFEDLPAAIDAVKGAGSEPGKLTDDQLLKHPVVVAELNKLKTTRQQDIDAAVEKTRKELTDRETALLNQHVRAHYEALVDKLNPNFTPGKEAAQRKRLVDDLIAEGGHRMGEAGKFELVDQDGNLLLGKLQNPLTTEDRARERAEELYGLPAAQKRESTGANQSQIDGATAYDGPKNQAEYEEKLFSLPPGEQRSKLTETFNAYKEKNAA